jgi:hypothetical protein
MNGNNMGTKLMILGVYLILDARMKHGFEPHGARWLDVITLLTGIVLVPIGFFII